MSCIISDKAKAIYAIETARKELLDKSLVLSQEMQKEYERFSRVIHNLNSKQTHILAKQQVLDDTLFKLLYSSCQSDHEV